MGGFFESEELNVEVQKFTCVYVKLSHMHL